MFRRTLLCWIAFAAVGAPVGFADEGDADRGKKLLPRLFESAAAAAAEATVRVQIDNKDVILGTVVADDGYILTKGSELIGKAGKLRGQVSCILRDGSAFDAQVLGYHKASDLMLLKVDAEALTPVKFAPATAVELGHFVATTALVPGKGGDPDSIGAAAVGVISAKSRRLYMTEREVENANRGYLGVRFERSADVKNTRIDEVTNPEAKKAGLKKGDAIVAIDGTPVASREDIFEVMNETRPETPVSLTVSRKDEDGKAVEKTFKFKLTKFAEMDRGAMQNTMGGTLSDRRGGFEQVIQHDTIITPKQCGGPLVDLDGKVLGLNIARAGRVETWALPADVLTPVYKELKAGKHPLKDKATTSPVKKEADKEK